MNFPQKALFPMNPKRAIFSVLKKTAMAMALLAVVLFLFNCFLLFGSYRPCSLTDAEAISTAINFCNRMGVPYPGEQRVRKGTGLELLLRRLENKDACELDFGGERDIQICMEVDGGMQEVIWYTNWELERQVQKKFGISPDSRIPRHWPPFLSEQQARDIVFRLAARIGLPADVTFSGMALDKERGIWRGYWQRRWGGYPYEDDRVGIEIMAVNGEFRGFRKVYAGKPCPTEVKVSKAEALEKGWSRAASLFDRDTWEKNRNAYKVERAELQIVHPNVIFGWLGPIWKSHGSRLAWVIDLELRDEAGEDKLMELGFHHSMIYKIDAATGKVIGGSDGRCK